MMDNNAVNGNLSKDYNKKRYIVLVMALSFFVPAIIMTLAYYNTQIYPGGANTILTYDMQAQFLPFYASLRYLGRSDSSLLYSFMGALGYNALPNYSTYLVNPLSWATLLFPIEKLPDGLYYLTIFRIGLCGLSFSFFLFFGRKEFREKIHPLAVFLLSCSYALMSYNILYCQCLLFLDITIMLPIVMFGLEQIIEGKKGLVFILAFAYSVCTTFQLAFAMGIFMILYLIYRLIDKKEIWKRVILRFGSGVLCSLGLASPLFLVALASAVGSRSGIEQDVVDGLTYFSLGKLLKQFASCQFESLTTGGPPLIFCGSLTIVLALIYLLTIKEKTVTKICAVFIILFYFASFCIVPLNMMWHGFVETLSFPGRYSYTFCFFLLVLAYEAYPTARGFLSSITKRGLLGFVGAILIVAVLAEQFMNASYLLATMNLRYKYRLGSAYREYLSRVSDVQAHIDDDNFYRVGRGSSQYTHDDGLLFGYNGVSYFSSYFVSDFMDFMTRMGYSAKSVILEDKGATPVMESILGIKYQIASSSEANMGYDAIYKNKPFVLSVNQHSLPLGFIMGSSNDMYNGIYRYTPYEDTGNAFAYQEILLSDIAGYECRIYDSLVYEMDEYGDNATGRHISVDFTAKNEDSVWIFCKDIDVENKKEQSDQMEEEDTDSNSGGSSEPDFSVTANGNELNRIRTKYTTTCTYAGAFKSGEKVHMEIEDEEDFGNPWIVHFDEKECNRILDKIRDEQGMDVTYHKNGVIRGNITAPYDNSYMMLTLPYMDGYVIKVDGKKTGYRDYRDALVLVELSEGDHEIEVSFCPPGLKAGLLLFFISVGMIVFLMLYPEKDKSSAEIDG